MAAKAIGDHIFSQEALAKAIKETIPPDLKPGEKIIVGTVDQTGAKVAVVVKLSEKIEAQAAFVHPWDGDDQVGAKLIARWK